MSINTTVPSTVSFCINEDSNSRLPIKLSTVSSTYILRILFSLMACIVSRIWRTCFNVFSIVSSRSSKFTGLVIKSNAPRFIATRMLSISPYAETITDFINPFCSLSLESKVSPSISGILMSLSTTSTS